MFTESVNVGAAQRAHWESSEGEYKLKCVNCQAEAGNAASKIYFISFSFQKMHTDRFKSK